MHLIGPIQTTGQPTLYNRVLCNLTDQSDAQSAYRFYTKTATKVNQHGVCTHKSKHRRAIGGNLTALHYETGHHVENFNTCFKLLSNYLKHLNLYR